MKIKLDGWQRIGIVLSIIWAIFITYVVIINYVNMYDPNRDYSSFVTWENKKYKTTDLYDPVFEGKTVVKTKRIVSAEKSLRFVEIIGATLIPIILAWLGVYIIIFTIRWIKAGFKKRL